MKEKSEQGGVKLKAANTGRAGAACRGSLKWRLCGSEVPKALFSFSCLGLSAFSINRCCCGICANDGTEPQKQSCSMQTPEMTNLECEVMVELYQLP